MKIEIRLAGFGGQGIITAGLILGRAAILAGLNAVQTQSYGPEARGGASRSEVIISDKEIYYPKVREPDILLVMSNPAFERYIGDLKEDGILIYDSSIIKNVNIKQKSYGIPATKMAVEKLGNRIVANIIMLAFLVEISKVFPRDHLIKAVLQSVPKGTEDINKKALNIGFEYVKKLKSEEGGR